MSSWAHLDVEVVAGETPRALLLRVNGKEAWVPKAHVSEARKYAKGDRGCTISVVERVARAKGLVD